MAITPSQGPVIKVTPQPDVYTVLLLVAIIGLAVAVVVCGMRLTAAANAGGYGMTVGQMFDELPKLIR